MENKEHAFEWVYRTPIRDLVALTFAELQSLQQQIMEEIRRAQRAKRWVEGAICKKRKDAAGHNDKGGHQS